MLDRVLLALWAMLLLGVGPGSDRWPRFEALSQEPPPPPGGALGVMVELPGGRALIAIRGEEPFLQRQRTAIALLLAYRDSDAPIAIRVRVPTDQNEGLRQLTIDPARP